MYFERHVILGSIASLFACMTSEAFTIGSFSRRTTSLSSSSSSIAGKFKNGGNMNGSSCPFVITPQGTKSSSVLLFASSSADIDIKSNLLSLTLEKPLGMILEEIEEGSPKGVKVKELTEAGSAFASKYRDNLIGLKVARVMGDDVTNVGFDSVMNKIIDAPSPVQIDFEFSSLGMEKGMDETIIASEEEAEGQQPQFEIGTPVTITVIQEGKDTVAIDAKVGDNLRKTLLENNVELYRGLKKKLGNCGGAGQCTFCAVDFTESEAWLERSEYEDAKIKKYPNARLACLNSIQGPATIRMQ